MGQEFRGKVFTGGLNGRGEDYERWAYKKERNVESGERRAKAKDL